MLPFFSQLVFAVLLCLSLARYSISNACQAVVLDTRREGDSRRNWPRFKKEAYEANMQLVERVKDLAGKKGCTPGQLALAWVHAQGHDVFPIPGTKRIKYLEVCLHTPSCCKFLNVI